MLLSPGHSPRHISTPSSSQRTLNLDSPNPNPRKRKGPTALDEDSYVAAIERIIERDFFPDIPKLRDRLDWLQAVRSAVPLLIGESQLRIIERRRCRRRSSTTTSASLPLPRTPASSVTPGLSSVPPDSTPSNPNFDPPVPDYPPSSSDDLNLTLDAFFQRYTSEDNESFSEILEKVNSKRKENYAHLIEGDGRCPSRLT